MPVNRGIDVDAHVVLLVTQLLFGLLHPDIESGTATVGIALVFLQEDISVVSHKLYELLLLLKLDLQ